MKILSIAIVRRDVKPARVLTAEYELSEFGYFKKSSVQEFLTFFSATLAERTQPGVRQTVTEQSNHGHVYARDQLAGVIVTDSEYPSRVAFTLLSKLLDEFVEQWPAARWPSTAAKAGDPLPCPWASLKGYLIRYQNPNEADAIMKVQRELDETKVILHKTIESVLDRGEKLDNLVAQSEQLSAQSKGFYKVAKQTNSSCCWTS